MIYKPATARRLDLDRDFDFLDDPNSWAPDAHEHRIYLTADLELYAVVDGIDYAACVMRLNYRTGEKYIPVMWSSLGHKWKRSHNPKHYARRSVQEVHGPESEMYESPITGKLVRNRQRTVRSVFLHHFVAERAGIVPPTDFPPGTLFKLDHRDGDSLNCRRANLRWVTPKFNTHNVRGALAHIDPLEWHRQNVPSV